MATCRCGTAWVGLNIAHCAACHLTFTTVANFDAHLDIKAGCRTSLELRELGYEPNERGQWRKPLPAGVNPWGGAP